MITVEEARALYPEDNGAHGFDHVLRVLALALRIGQAEEADLEIVRTAALLHDVGRAEADPNMRCVGPHRDLTRARDGGGDAVSRQSPGSFRGHEVPPVSAA